MSGNRRRHTNTVQVGSLLKWVVIAIFLGIAGLGYVYLSNQTQRSGNDIHTLETHLRNLQARNNEAEVRIALLSSHKELQRRLDEGFIKLVSIPDASIVRINVLRRSTDEIRPVANGGMEK
jgi:hypothetical protein